MLSIRRSSLLFVLCVLVASAATTSTKGDYERRMQSRTATFAPQCTADDPATAQRERIARSQRAVRELEAIRPPSEVTNAHRRLTEGERGVLATLRKFLPRYERLARLIRRARADGEINGKEQRQIQTESQRLLVESQPSRRVQRLQSSAFSEFRKKGYDIVQRGPPKGVYERRVQTLVDRAGKSSSSFRKTTSATALRAQLLRARDVTFRAARALSAITPRRDVLNPQSKLVGGLCMRARTYSGYAETLRTRADGRTVRLIFESARDADRIFRVYAPAVDEYRQAGYRIRAPR